MLYTVHTSAYFFTHTRVWTKAELEDLQEIILQYIRMNRYVCTYNIIYFNLNMILFMIFQWTLHIFSTPILLFLPICKF